MTDNYSRHEGQYYSRHVDAGQVFKACRKSIQGMKDKYSRHVEKYSWHGEQVLE